MQVLFLKIYIHTKASHFPIDFFQPCHIGAVIGNSVQAKRIILLNLFLFLDEDVDGAQKRLLDAFFFQRRCLAGTTFLKFVVAVPVVGSVFFIGGMSYLSAVEDTAVLAYDPSREDRNALHSATSGFPSSEFLLNHLEHFRTHDGRMIFLNIKLGRFAFVALMGMRQKVCCHGLLKQRITLVLLVFQNALNNGGVPLRFTIGVGTPSSVSRLAIS